MEILTSEPMVMAVAGGDLVGVNGVSSTCKQAN